MRHKFNLFFFSQRANLIGPSQKKSWNYGGSPKQKIRWKDEVPPPPLWPNYIGEKGRTLSKTYGIKASAIGNTFGELIGNLIGTHWELERNMLGTNEKLETICTYQWCEQPEVALWWRGSYLWMWTKYVWMGTYIWSSLSSQLGEVHLGILPSSSTLDSFGMKGKTSG